VTRVLVATGGGIHEMDGSGRPGSLALQGRSVTRLAPARSDVWAVIERSELWREEGRTWRLVARFDGIEPTSITNMDRDLLVGSEGARLFKLDGEGFEPVRGFDDAPGRDTWYTPWGGPPATRSMANWDGDVYVNVHVGGILHNVEGSATWAPTIDIDSDVHQVTTAEDLVLAACAEGLAVSSDRGSTWSSRADGLESLYSRSVAVCGDSLLVSASRGPRGGRAAVYRTGLRTGPFERCASAGPGWFDDNIDTFCLDALPDGSFAAFGTTEGTVYASTDCGSTWGELATGLQKIRRVLILP
jgi:hypothetical protein